MTHFLSLLAPPKRRLVLTEATKLHNGICAKQALKNELMDSIIHILSAIVLNLSFLSGINCRWFFANVLLRLRPTVRECTPQCSLAEPMQKRVMDRFITHSLPFCSSKDDDSFFFSLVVQLGLSRLEFSKFPKNFSLWVVSCVALF